MPLSLGALATTIINFLFLNPLLQNNTISFMPTHEQSLRLLSTLNDLLQSYHIITFTGKSKGTVKPCSLS